MKRHDRTQTIDAPTLALIGQPNVGKSTLFNRLTGLRQHTGNWTGKTVGHAEGTARSPNATWRIVDLPGVYSLHPHSPEEEVTRDFLLSGTADVVAVVCDATCLERSLQLVLSVCAYTRRLVVCINLIDEAGRKGLRIDAHALETRLGLPVIAISARNGTGLDQLTARLDDFLTPSLSAPLSPLLDDLSEARDKFLSEGEHSENARMHMTERVGRAAAELTQAVVSVEDGTRSDFDRKLDRILLSRRYGLPIMLLLLGLILWLTIAGANIPSRWLSSGLAWIGDRLEDFARLCALPEMLIDLLCNGIFRVVAFVVSVMLPPMAIFFPLFTLLEDFGYLPRVAFNLDHHFKKANACGKQCLTMCMGLGCNAAGVTGCRIIDSPREKLIAILTNSLMPCNGRFPTLITLISLFLAGSTFLASLFSAAILVGVILLGISATFLVSRLLSKTVLKGEASSFTLELPPYRRPLIGQVILRSLLDRTLYVLGRAVAVAAPAGLLLWLFTHVQWGDASLLSHFSKALDPAARWFGLDGVILMAFILGFPANEIVLPIILMTYLSVSQIVPADNLTEMHAILTAHGWTWITAACVLLFTLFHWPCSTTCWTIQKETGRLRWTLLSMAVPTAIGLFLCFVCRLILYILGF